MAKKPTHALRPNTARLPLYHIIGLAVAIAALYGLATLSTDDNPGRLYIAAIARR